MRNIDKINELLRLEHPDVPTHRHLSASLSGLNWCKKHVYKKASAELQRLFDLNPADMFKSYTQVQ